MAEKMGKVEINHKAHPWRRVEDHPVYGQVSEAKAEAFRHVRNVFNNGTDDHDRLLASAAILSINLRDLIEGEMETGEEAVRENREYYDGLGDLRIVVRRHMNGSPDLPRDIVKKAEALGRTYQEFDFGRVGSNELVDNLMRIIFASYEHWAPIPDSCGRPDGALKDLEIDFGIALKALPEYLKGQYEDRLRRIKEKDEPDLAPVAFPGGKTVTVPKEKLAGAVSERTLFDDVVARHSVAITWKDSEGIGQAVDHLRANKDRRDVSREQVASALSEVIARKIRYLHFCEDTTVTLGMAKLQADAGTCQRFMRDDERRAFGHALERIDEQVELARKTADAMRASADTGLSGPALRYAVRTAVRMIEDAITDA